MISLVPVPWSRHPHCACGVGKPNCRKFLRMSLIVRSLHSAASAIEAKVNISKDNRHSWIVTYMGHSQPPEGPIPDTTIRAVQLGQRQCLLRLGITCRELSRSLIWETICVALGIMRNISLTLQQTLKDLSQGKSPKQKNWKKALLGEDETFCVSSQTRYFHLKPTSGLVPSTSSHGHRHSQSTSSHRDPSGYKTANA